MIARPAPPGSRGTDSLAPISAATARALKASGFDFCMRYLGSVTGDELESILAAGLGFMPITFGDTQDPSWGDGARTVRQCQALGLPHTTCVWLDIEGPATLEKWTVDELAARVDAWANEVAVAGFTPSAYFAPPQPFTSQEMYRRAVIRYWRGGGRIEDRRQELAEPSIGYRGGWCMFQTSPQHVRCGVLVDVDVTTTDYNGRVPIWAEASP